MINSASSPFAIFSNFTSAPSIFSIVVEKTSPISFVSSPASNSIFLILHAHLSHTCLNSISNTIFSVCPPTLRIILEQYHHDRLYYRQQFRQFLRRLPIRLKLPLLLFARSNCLFFHLC